MLPKDIEGTLELAASHGLKLIGAVEFNEMGLDYRVCFAKDRDGQDWVLRIPRRSDALPKLEYEAKVLEFVKRKISVSVPDWRIKSPELVAYLRLKDNMALTFDSKSHAVHWNIDQGSSLYIESLAKVLVELHSSSAEAEAAGIKSCSPDAVRANILQELESVKREIGVGREQELAWRSWLDDDRLWPGFSTLVHGDLYAGHITADKDSRVSGIIDWTEAHIGDSSIDFAGHLTAFGSESLKTLIAAYADAGGRTWPMMREQIEARSSASGIRYGIFALQTGSEEHLAAARALLGLG